MTTAGQGENAAPGGMEYGPDYVAARLSVEIPDEAVQGVREITQEVDKFRIAMEAATHVEADFNRYLDDMAQAMKLAAEAQTNLTQQLMTYISMSSRMGTAPSMGVPTGGFQQPFTGVSAQDMPPTRPPNPADVVSQLRAAPTGAPAEYLNMMQQRGGVTAQDTMNLSAQTIQQLATKIAEREQAVTQQQQKTDGNAVEPAHPTGGMQERVQRATGLAGQVMNEVQGGSIRGKANLAMRGIGAAAGALSRMGQKGSAGTEDTVTVGGGPEEGGTDQTEDGRPSPEAGKEGGMAEKLGGLGGILGKLGGTIAAAVGIFETVQKGGEMVQGWRNIASMRGGGAGEGAEVSFKARMLAMNPFLSQDQARQIYQSVMSEGYADASGAGADNVIDFMKHNLESMNISVADSAKMLRDTVAGSGRGDKEGVAGSVKMLGEELDNIRTLSREGVMSQPDFRKSVMAMQSAMEAQGVSPEQAARQAMIATTQGSADQILKGQYAGIGADIQGSVAAQMQIRAFGGVNVPAGVLPGATAAYLGETGQEGPGMDQMMRRYALMAHNRYPGTDLASRVNAVYVFQQYMKRIDPQSEAANSVPKAKSLMADLLNDQSYNQAEEDVDKAGPAPSTGLGGGAGGGAAATPSPAPARGGGAAESTPGGGGGGGGGGGVGKVVHNVTVGLTSEASKLLQVISGGQAPTIPRNERDAKMGRNGAAVNNG